MSKKPSSLLFDRLHQASRYFDCPLDNVDQLLLRYVSIYGYPKWLQGKSKIVDLERFGKAILDDTRNVIEVSGWNNRALRMLRFIIEECGGKWAIKTSTVRRKTIHYFHFDNEIDFIMARLAV